MPEHYLNLVVMWLTPIVNDLRAPAALILFAFVCFRPQAASRCVMIGRVLTLMACVLWMAAAYQPFAACARLGDWVMFASAFASHVCEVVMSWANVMAAKRAEGPGLETRLARGLIAGLRSPSRPPR